MLLFSPAGGRWHDTMSRAPHALFTFPKVKPEAAVKGEMCCRTETMCSTYGCRWRWLFPVSPPVRSQMQSDMSNALSLRRGSLSWPAKPISCEEWEAVSLISVVGADVRTELSRLGINKAERGSQMEEERPVGRHWPQKPPESELRLLRLTVE